MKVWFEDDAVDRPFPGERFLWIITQPYWIHWEIDGMKKSLAVPQDFITDFASVPRALWAIVPPWDNFIRDAAICHDRAYETNEISRELADALLYYGMIISGSTHAHAYAVWAAVRVAGASSYRTGRLRQLQRIDKLKRLKITQNSQPSTEERKD